MKKRKVLIANTGKVLTNGTEYGKKIFLADGVDPSTYHEISDEEYSEILEDMFSENDD